MTHVCVSDLTIIGSDNGLSPGRRQAINRTNAGILLIRPSGTNFSEVLIEILIFSFTKMRLEVSSAKRRPFCLGHNVLIPCNNKLCNTKPFKCGRRIYASPEFYCPWTFFQNIGFNTVLTDPFMSHLATQLGYSAGEFQALQLIVLAAFGVVD